jgi:hypothetical protein
MRNEELLKRLHNQVKDTDIKLPLSVYLSMLMLSNDVESKDAYEFSVKTIEDYLQQGMQVTLDLDSE